MNFIQACKKKKKVYISSDNKHENFHMKGIFFKEYSEHGRAAS